MLAVTKLVLTMRSGEIQMQKTLFSRHIPKDKMRSEDAKNVSADLVLFNRMKQASVRLQLRGSKPEIPEDTLHETVRAVRPYGSRVCHRTACNGL